MLKFLIPFVLSLFLAFSASAELKAHNFFGTPWGSNRERVTKDFGATPDKDGDLVTRFVREGRTSVFVFSFEDDKLTRVVTMSESLATSREGAAQFCDAVASSMTQKHGTPRTLMDPDMGPILEWKNEDTQVQMGCQFDAPGLAIMIWKPLEQSKTPKGVTL
jgi:hypothetical protein